MHLVKYRRQSFFDRLRYELCVLYIKLIHENKLCIQDNVCLINVFVAMTFKEGNYFTSKQKKTGLKVI